MTIRRELIDAEAGRSLDGPRHSFGEETLVVSVVEDHLRDDSVATTGLAHDGHVAGVATKGCNVLLDPAEGLALVE